MFRIALLTIAGVAFAWAVSSQADEPVGITRLSTEPMTVKVYSVPDLIANADVPRSIPNPLLTKPGMAEALQQIQLQAQLIQASVQAAQATSVAEPSNDIAKKLERLKKALRIAAPKDSWVELGGDGEIEIYPDAVCLIIRQTPAGHEAIADLLAQLRAAQSVHIELTVELLSLDDVEDDEAAKLLPHLLNQELNDIDLRMLRQGGAKTASINVVRIMNGRSTSTGLSIGLPVEMTAVASADRSTVEFRAHLNAPFDEDVEAMRQALSQTRTVSVGTSIAYAVGPEGLVAVVTPKIVDRSTVAAKQATP